MPTFAEYLEKWLKHSTPQGLTNPLIKMPVKRFRLLQPQEFVSIANGGTLIIGTMSDPIARNLYKNFLTYIRERGEHCAFLCCGSTEMPLASTVGQASRTAMFPICLKRATLHTTGEHIKATVAEDEPWQFNVVFGAYLRALDIRSPTTIASPPEEMAGWIKAQLGNRGQVKTDSYIGLFSSQQLVIQERLTEPGLRQALAHNPLVKSKIEGSTVEAAALGEVTDEGIEELGLALACDDSQLRVVQLSHAGCSLQVEGPPGTGKSQTIANIIANGLYHQRRVLLVCDKKAAIDQVQERLANCGLSPALLNLHDEDLDKRQFLKQATDQFESSTHTSLYPLAELRETRKTLNDRVTFGRTIAHPSLQVTKRDALGGLIQLRKELKDVPSISIANWQALSKERLMKLIERVREWPELSPVLTDERNVWNDISAFVFQDNPNAPNELRTLVQKVLAQLESLESLKESAATVGIQTPFNSDASVAQVLALARTVTERPACHPKLIGNRELTLIELDQLKSHWEQRAGLIAARHPVPLTTVYPSDTELEAKELLRNETADSWEDLSARETYHSEQIGEIEQIQQQYRRICEHLGLCYSPLLKVRRSQLQAVEALAGFDKTIPRDWWNRDSTPVLTVASWKAQLKACANHVRLSPFPMHLLSLERVATTHWSHLEAKAEHGFNAISYCIHFVNDRKCKYALRQIFPTIPRRGFKEWQEITLHAVTGLPTLQALRSAANTHTVLKQLTSAYLAEAHEDHDRAEDFLLHEDIQILEKAAALAEEMRSRNDLFETGSAHWQTFWQFGNPGLLAEVKTALSVLDTMSLPRAQRTDSIEDALKFHTDSQRRIHRFLESVEIQAGNRTNSVLAAFDGQKQFARCEQELKALAKYLMLQGDAQSEPDWRWLYDIISWRDVFEQQRESQRLDIDSPIWPQVEERLEAHQRLMEDAYNGLDNFFERCSQRFADYAAVSTTLTGILAGLPQYPLWLEKKQWQGKIQAFPEIEELWDRVLVGSVSPDHAERLFCFNLLRLCDPVARPHGPEFRQTLKTFSQQDDKLASWIIDRLRTLLRQSMQDAAQRAAQSASELRRLAGLQRVRGTVRELLNAHIDYLVAAKPCWMMSPTSLANLIDSKIFEGQGPPFDLVIFDEASQIRVLDGLLSMCFGKQVIIVGDRNQLPPTDFFASFASSDLDAEAEDFGISESLLDEFAGVFEEGKTQVMLMSHYRSETPDLIRFSNDWFYGTKLEMYPPAHVTGIGRRLHYVPNGIYSEIAGQRTNPAEAREVIKLIESHVNECPHKSLGVVTMNIPQMELIDELCQKASGPVKAFCADESKFFVRNLETVQGDEMDRIILSLTYGKNPAGNFSASILGPLTRSGGERRLNVAITRSRSGFTILSSLRSADLEATTAQSRGFQCLKALLLDMETQQARDFGIGNKRFERRIDGVSNVVHCGSPFEEQVVEFLENEGYEIECQHGAGKYRLDIVVKERGRNLLAIECDGAGYHSSLVARTRDRARQRILEKQGWRFHRVWSTNWWHFEQQEKDAIIAAINSSRSRHSSRA